MKKEVYVIEVNDRCGRGWAFGEVHAQKKVARQRLLELRKLEENFPVKTYWKYRLLSYTRKKVL